MNVAIQYKTASLHKPQLAGDVVSFGAEAYADKAVFSLLYKRSQVSAFYTVDCLQKLD